MNSSETLRAIRSLEVEMARRIEEVREEEASAMHAAKAEAARLVDDALARGKAAARRRYDDAIAAAEEEAQEIAEQAHVGADALRSGAAGDVPAAVEDALALLLSPPLERGK